MKDLRTNRVSRLFKGRFSRPLGPRSDTSGLPRPLASLQYKFPIADAYLLKLEGQAPFRKGDAMVAKPAAASEEEAMNDQEEEEMNAAGKTDADKDIPDAPTRPEEKRRLNWEGKTYLVRLLYSYSVTRPGADVFFSACVLNAGASDDDRYVC